MYIIMVMVNLNLKNGFNAQLSSQRYWRGPRSQSENVYYYGNGQFEFEKRFNAQLSSQRYWRGPRSQSENVYITVMVDLNLITV